MGAGAELGEEYDDCCDAGAGAGPCTVYVDCCETGDGAGLKLGELITTGRGVMVVVVVVVVRVVLGRV